jgi:chromate reductase
MQSEIKLVGISGSLRVQSYNSNVLREVTSLLPEGTVFAEASIADLPFYSADIEQQGFPAAVESFRRAAAAADAFVKMYAGGIGERQVSKACWNICRCKRSRRRAVC